MQSTLIIFFSVIIFIKASLETKKKTSFKSKNLAENTITFLLQNRNNLGECIKIKDELTKLNQKLDNNEDYSQIFNKTKSSSGVKFKKLSNLYDAIDGIKIDEKIEEEKDNYSKDNSNKNPQSSGNKSLKAIYDEILEKYKILPEKKEITDKMFKNLGKKNYKEFKRYYNTEKVFQILSVYLNNNKMTNKYLNELNNDYSEFKRKFRYKRGEKIKYWVKEGKFIQEMIFNCEKAKIKKGVVFGKKKFEKKIFEDVKEEYENYISKNGWINILRSFYVDFENKDGKDINYEYYTKKIREYCKIPENKSIQKPSKIVNIYNKNNFSEEDEFFSANEESTEFYSVISESNFNEEPQLNSETKNKNFQQTNSSLDDKNEFLNYFFESIPKNQVLEFIELYENLGNFLKAEENEYFKESERINNIINLFKLLKKSYSSKKESKPIDFKDLKNKYYNLKNNCEENEEKYFEEFENIFLKPKPSLKFYELIQIMKKFTKIEIFDLTENSFFEITSK